GGLNFLGVHRGAAVAAVTRSRVDDDAVDEPGHRNPPLSAETDVWARSCECTAPQRRSRRWRKKSGVGADDAHHVDELAATLGAEFDSAGGGREQRVVATAADVHTGMEVGAALPHQDLAGL